MKSLSTVIFAAVATMSFSTFAAGPNPSPEEACRHIKDQDCYGSLECNKKKRKYAQCVKEKAQEQAAKKAIGKKPPKGPQRPQ